MPKSIKVVGIGAGNIAHHLLPALKSIGCDIEQVYSRKISNARILATELKCEAINKLSKVNPDADLYLIMVADDAIKEVAKALPNLTSKQYLAHTSGSSPITLLKNNAENFGSFYPLQSFKKTERSDINKVPFLVCGNNDAAQRFLRIVARKISGKVKECNDIERLKYHMSAVFINNFTNHLACISDNILAEANLDPSILKPITESTFDKILNGNPCKIQTGPASRNDIKLQKKHLLLLKDEPERKAIYKSISKSISKSSK